MQKILLQFLYSVVIRNFLKVFVGVRMADARFLLKEKQFIIVANHNSHLDTLTLLASLPRKIILQVKPVAAQDHFGKTRFKEKLTRYFINALLIQRKRDKENIKNDPIYKMVDALDKGFSLIIFPEGTRGEPEVQQPIKPGIGYVLSQRPGVKYVPAFMKGMGKAMPKNDSLIVPYNSSLVYGDPAAVQSNDVMAIVKEVENALNQLRDKSS